MLRVRRRGCAELEIHVRGDAIGAKGDPRPRRFLVSRIEWELAELCEETRTACCSPTRAEIKPRNATKGKGENPNLGVRQELHDWNGTDGKGENPKSVPQHDLPVIHEEDITFDEESADDGCDGKGENPKSQLLQAADLL